MQHFSHPDAEIWAGFFSAAVNGVLACFRQYTDASEGGKHDHDKAVELCAQYADKMLAKYRERFPLPTQDELQPIFPRPDWDPRFGAFPETVFVGMPTFSGTRNEQQFGRTLRFPDIVNAHREIRGSLEDFQKLFQVFGASVPQWVADVANESVFLSPDKKQRVYDYLSLMLQGQRVNLKSGSIKGAFDWKTAPGGAEFWTDISQSLPVVPEDIPAKILPDDEKD